MHTVQLSIMHLDKQKHGSDTDCSLSLSLSLSQHQVMQLRPEQFLTDYRTFAVVIAFLFGIVGPVSLLTGIPAAYMAIAVS